MKASSKANLSRAISPAAGHSGAQFSFQIDRESTEGLVRQITVGIKAEIDRGSVNAGVKLPSVRRMSKLLGVSTFSVVAAYDTLASLNVISSRRGSGYFVRHRAVTTTPAPETGAVVATSVSDFWLSHDVFAFGRQLASPGCGWLPASWYSQRTLLCDAIRRVARSKPEQLVSYGHPAGYGRLRQHIACGLTERLFAVSADQIVLAHGATHAIDLVIRTLLNPGDAVMVENPGYSNLHGLLVRHGCLLVPIPRGPSGLDLEAVARLSQQHRPKAMFVTTVLQNPLGTTLRQFEAHRLLAMAEGFEFLIVEDDIFRSFGSDSDPCLAAMDGLSRVISVNGFSKTIAPSLRVGYVACNRKLAEDIIRTKMVAGLTSSEISERVVLEVLSDPEHRRSLGHIRTRLTSGRERYRAALETAGLTLLANPDGGMFISAGWPVEPSETCNARIIAEEALKDGIVLAPGNFFCVPSADNIWFRFNVGYDDVSRLQAFLRKVPQLYDWKF
jgi:DNA-binding transcriptional MocR family regulator